MIDTISVRLIGITLTAIIGTAQGAAADEFSNILEIDILGSDNRLYLVQEASPEARTTNAPNSIAVTIEGNRNGGFASAWSSDTVATNTALSPGQLLQEGFNNKISLAVLGDDNLFAVSQIGERNTVSGTVTGSWNQSVVYQSGVGNSAVFSQTGQRNTIMVSQTNW